MKRRYFEQLCNLAIELFGFDAQITRDSNDRMELYVNSHTISVEHSLLGYVMDYTSNKQLLYDEPESRIDIGNIDTIARYYNRMNSDVVFVGSICTPEDTTFKQFHAYAAAQSGYTATITAESFPERLASVQEMRRYMTDRVYRMEYMCDWSAGEDEGTWYT
ncbi:hypothetical protein SAMN02799624_05239 [Paenibacillus sp. UNC496MF]|nr:hypothetical protein SAMN02799624_05239 [Paenibacillus sp. UNC496MF]